MYPEHPLTDPIIEELNKTKPGVRSAVLHLFDSYHSPLRTAERDRECLGALLDEIGVRLDQVHPHPETPPSTSREVVMRAFRQHLTDQRRAAHDAMRAAAVYGFGDD